MNQLSSDNRSSSPAADAQHIRLACQACQRKKIKCDRTFPCGQCTKSSLTCVPSSRKQRVRHAGKRVVDGELRNRIAKLESLVESLSNEPNAIHDKQSNDAEASPPTKASSVNLASPVLGRYIANGFWSSLTTEVGALREALEEEDEDDATPDTFDAALSSPGNKIGPEWPADHDLIVCPPGRIFVMPGVIEDPEPHLRQYLIDIFFKNAEPMWKVFHRPTLRAAVEQNADYLGHPPGSIQHDVLRRLIWLAAFNTLSEAEVLSLTGRSKIDTVMRYRRFVGITISQIDLMNTGDLTILQCLLFFITVCRSTDKTRRTWTSLALLVRNAQAVYMNHDDPNATPFIRELRKRLWYYTRLLDKYCALDRGSLQIIRNAEFTIPFPTNTNDHLFGPDSTSIPEVHGEITDMTFALMCFESCNTIEALIVPENAPNGPTWEERRKIAVDMGVELEEKYLRYLDLSNPFYRLQHAICKSITTNMIVRAIRPMQRHLSSVPPPVGSPEVLQLAVNNMEAAQAIFNDPEFEPWRWIKWVPWHCIAVALAGLCSIRGTPLADRAWILVEPAFKWSSQHVADGEDGMLWRPVAKLYKKATAFRDAAPAVQPAARVLATTQSSTFADSRSSHTKAVDPAVNWCQPWPTTDGSHDPAIKIDYLSNNMSSMAPFDMPSSSSSILSNGTLPAVSLTDLPEMDFSSATFNDTSWTDWGQVTDEFNDPLAAGNGINMDFMMMNQWNVDNNMTRM